MAKKKESPKDNSNKKSNTSSKKIREPIREKNRVKLKDKPAKVSNKDLDKKDKPKKEEVSKPSNKKVSKDDNTSNSDILRTIAIVSGIIFLILLLIFVFSQDRNNNILDEVQNEELLLENLEVIVITNSNCEFCQEDLVIRDLQVLLNQSNLTIREIEFDSLEAQQLKEALLENTLNFDFSPIFMITKELEAHQLFNDSQFQALFIQANEYYVLNPQITQIKYTDELLMLPNEKISIGNPQGVQITYISDYFCTRCNIMEGKPEIVEQAQSQGIIPSNFSAPIPQLLLSSLYANMSDLSFEFNFIPAPVNENSTKAHKAVFCAAEQNSFVQMHATLINDNNLNLNYTYNDYLTHALTIGLNESNFESCYNNEAEDYISATEEYLVEMGISSLPITIVGHYPSTEIMDSQTMALLLQSELNTTSQN